MIYRNMPMAEYRGQYGLSKHELDNFAVAPSYYLHRKQQEWKPSRSMEMGTLIHALVLEGRKEFAVGPQVDRRTKDGKAEWQAFCEDNIGLTIVNDEEAAVIKGCYESALPLLGKVKADFNSDVEISMFWQRKGIHCKGRPDLIGEINGELAIVDLKTTNDIRNFDSSFYRFRYDVQASWYQRGAKAAMNLEELPAFWFLVVDTEAPHLVQFMRCSSELLEQANARVEEDLTYFKQCQTDDVWPGLPETKLILPRAW